MSVVVPGSHAFDSGRSWVA